LKKELGIDVKAEKKIFSSKEAFVEWKDQVQTATKSLFVRQSAYDSTEVWHCNRSGLKQKNLHRMKEADHGVGHLVS
jgi:hypothetical protein